MTADTDNSLALQRKYYKNSVSILLKKVYKKNSQVIFIACNLINLGNHHGM